jgi:uncharacterized protein YjbJ (UPF0337 family)
VREKHGRYTGDIREIYGRYTGDVQGDIGPDARPRSACLAEGATGDVKEIYGRCTGDIREIYGRYRAC